MSRQHPLPTASERATPPLADPKREPAGLPALVPSAEITARDRVTAMADPGTEITYAFAAFLAAILPGNLQREAAAEAAGRAARSLRAYYRPDRAGTLYREDFMLAGSLSRRCAVKPLKDGPDPAVDLFYQLPSRCCPASAMEALTDVAKALRLSGHADAVPVLGVPAIRLRVGPLVVLVRPAREDGGVLSIPGHGDGPFPVWIRTDPVAEAAAMRTLSHAHAERPRMLVAILKAWRDHCGVPVPGFALEVMVRAFYRDVSRPTDRPEDPAVLVETFMAWARNATPCTFALPGGGRNLFIDGDWHPYAETAYWRAVRARGLLRDGDVGAASEEWQAILGGRFPKLATT
ncbi:MAG: hypothetical protein ACPGYL_12305, partial [Rhodospirillaceae bacterium]